MKLPLYQVDAFTDKVFGGNPAAVCPLDAWLPDATLQSIAAENNLAETAFFIPRGDDFDLRWFTPTIEMDLCGHATLAAAFVLFNEQHFSGKAIEFHFCTQCGCLTHYLGTARDEQGRQKVAVNFRMSTQPEKIADLLIDRFDGLDSFDDLPGDGRCVRDVWF